jgi:hypothetical protein
VRCSGSCPSRSGDASVTPRTARLRPGAEVIVPWAVRRVRCGTTAVPRARFAPGRRRRSAVGGSATATSVQRRLEDPVGGTFPAQRLETITRPRDDRRTVRAAASLHGRTRMQRALEAFERVYIANGSLVRFALILKSAAGRRDPRVVQSRSASGLAAMADPWCRSDSSKPARGAEEQGEQPAALGRGSARAGSAAAAAAVFRASAGPRGRRGAALSATAAAN